MSAGYLFGFASRHGWVSEDRRTGGFAHAWTVPVLEGDEQTEAYLCESLYTALTHEEPRIVLRAVCQAYEYLGKLRGSAASTGFYSDHALQARSRVEAMLSGRA